MLADPSASNPNRDAAETAALAKGGRTSFFGYVLRLAALFPFLFIAGRLYGAEALGRFAYATMVVELVAMLVMQIVMAKVLVKEVVKVMSREHLTTQIHI